MRKIVAANWKMNLRRESAATLAGALAGDMRELWLFPSFVHLNSVRMQLSGTQIKMGAQDLSVHKDGAHTGDVSAEMLKDAGCEMVLIGHSERRLGNGEGGDMLLRKLVRACAAGLKPLFCVGETRPERDSAQATAAVESQLMILKRLAPEARAMIVAVAYEPVWAIGTGLNASLAQVEEMHALVAKKLNSFGMLNTPILYGGSVSPDNARELLGSRLVDGLLVGSASLNYDALSMIDELARKSTITARTVTAQLEPPPPPEAYALLFERDTDDFTGEVKLKGVETEVVSETTSQGGAPVSDGAFSRYEKEISNRKPPTQPLPRTSQGRLQPMVPTSQGRLQPVAPASQPKLAPVAPSSQGKLPPLTAEAMKKPTVQLPPKAEPEKPTSQVAPASPGSKTDKPSQADEAQKSGPPAKKANTYDDTDRPSWV